VFGCLAPKQVARLCVLEADFPVAFPVNYRLMVEDEENVVFVIRTRADGILDQPGRKASWTPGCISASHNLRAADWKAPKMNGPSKKGRTYRCTRTLRDASLPSPVLWSARLLSWSS
jgi:hypothetical protein